MSDEIETIDKNPKSWAAWKMEAERLQAIIDGMALAAMDSSESVELPLDYLQGHKDGLEWAAQLAEANHPETGDWLYDDPIELSKAIRKGPDMPPVQPVADSEPVAWEFWPEDDYEQMFLVHGTDDPASETVDHSGKKWISSPLFRGKNTSVIKENQLRIQGIEALEKFLTASPTECSMSAGVLLALECSRILKVIIKNNGWGDFTGGKFEEGTSETIISDLREHHPKTCHAAMLAAAPQSPGSEPATVPGKWIPVSERMPDNTEPVLCIEKRADFGTYGQPFVCWHDGGGWVGKTNYRPIVTHWMSLPAGPQEVR